MAQIEITTTKIEIILFICRRLILQIKVNDKVIDTVRWEKLLTKYEKLYIFL